MNGEILGEIQLSGSTRLVFSVGVWQGEARADVRKYKEGENYSGPTPAGLSLTAGLLDQLLDFLRPLGRSAPQADGIHKPAARKSRASEIRVAVIAADDGESLPKVDIREHIEKGNYTGFTKKGIRFGWDKLPHVIKLLETQVVAVAGADGSSGKGFAGLQPSLFETQPTLAREAPPKHASDTTDLLPDPLLEFPKDFLPSDAKLHPAVTLPDDALSIEQTRDGGQVVKARRGFAHTVRNDVEGRFFLYAHLRGVRKVQSPAVMIHVFKTVVGYEKYARELRQSLIADLESRCGNRNLAQFQTDQLLTERGLPKL